MQPVNSAFNYVIFRHYLSLGNFVEQLFQSLASDLRSKWISLIAGHLITSFTLKLLSLWWESWPYSDYPELGVGRTEKINVQNMWSHAAETSTHFHCVLFKYSDNST